MEFYAISFIRNVTGEWTITKNDEIYNMCFTSYYIW